MLTLLFFLTNGFHTTETHTLKAFIFAPLNTWGSIILNQWRTAQEHRVWQVICGNFCGLRCTAILQLSCKQCGISQNTLRVGHDQSWLYFHNAVRAEIWQRSQETKRVSLSKTNSSGSKRRMTWWSWSQCEGRGQGIPVGYSSIDKCYEVHWNLTLTDCSDTRQLTKGVCISNTYLPMGLTTTPRR